MGLWKRVRALLGEAAASTHQEPVIHQVLTRHHHEQEALERWEQALVARRLRDWLAAQFAMFSSGAQRLDSGIDFLDTPSSKGFVIHFADTQYSLREAEMLQLYLRKQVLAQPYRTQVADTKTYAFSAGTERTDRYYLKPRPAWSAPVGHEGGVNTYTADQFDQQFGNILVELIIRNDAPHQLKFSATAYHDRVYQTALSFAELMELVLGE